MPRHSLSVIGIGRHYSPEVFQTTQIWVATDCLRNPDLDDKEYVVLLMFKVYHRQDNFHTA